MDSPEGETPGGQTKLYKKVRILKMDSPEGETPGGGTKLLNMYVNI